jgi:hypothetical protein
MNREYKNKYTINYNEKTTLLKIRIEKRLIKMEFKIKLKDLYNDYIETTRFNIYENINDFKHHLGYSKLNFIENDIEILIEKYFKRNEFYEFMIEYFENSELNDLIYIFGEYDFNNKIYSTAFNSYILEDYDDYWEKVYKIRNHYKKLYKKYEDLEKEAIYKIENQYLESKYNPKYKMCRNRLDKEYDEY